MTTLHHVLSKLFASFDAITGKPRRASGQVPPFGRSTGIFVFGHRWPMYCLVVMAVMAVVGAGGCTVTAYTVCQPDAGEIVFGSDLDAAPTRARDCSHTFRQQGDFAFVAVFPRQVSGRVEIEVIKDSEPAREAGGYTFSAPGDYLHGRWHLNDLPGPGHYEVRVKSDSEILASGSFDLTN